MIAATGKSQSGDLLLFGGAALISAALLMWSVGDTRFAAVFLAGLIATAAVLRLVSRKPAA